MTTFSLKVLLWKQKWIDVDKLRRTFINAMHCSDELLFSRAYKVTRPGPRVHKYLKIVVTLHIIIKCTERSFSTLKHLKLFLKNSTEGNRPNGMIYLLDTVYREIGTYQ